MGTEPKPVVHPSWCDPDHCAAPDVVPTENIPGRYHRSAPVTLSRLGLHGVVADSEVTAGLFQAVAPWGTEVGAEILVNGQPVVHTRLEIAAALVAALADALRPAVAEFHASYPSLPIPGAPLFDGSPDPV